MENKYIVKWKKDGFIQYFCGWIGYYGDILSYTEKKENALKMDRERVYEI